MLTFLVIDTFIYSGRKQRIQFWILNYKRYLVNRDGNEKKAIADILREFYNTKYGLNFDASEYFYIEPLIEEIIRRQFRFEKYRDTNGDLIYKIRRHFTQRSSFY